MEFLEIARTRRSIRGYSDKPVEDEKLRYVLECARIAPSARNSQVWGFVVIKDKDTILAITNSCPVFNKFLASAPIIIVACAAGNSSRHNEQEYYLVDVAIATEHLVLAAAEKGLGTCWIAAFDEKRVKEILSIPESARVVALIPLGYPGKEGAFGLMSKAVKILTPRKKLEEIAFSEKWGN